MAKLKKKTLRLIIGGGALALLVIALVLLLVLVPSGGGGDDASSNAASSDTSITLVNQKQADVKKIHVKRENSEYDIVLTGDKVWGIEALKKFEQQTNLYSLAANEIASVKADSILMDTQKDLKKYGLDQPNTIVTATFADGSTFTMKIGDTDPVSYGHYMTVEGKDPIYIYSGASYFAYDLNDYVSPAIFNITPPTTTVSTESGSTTQAEELIFDEMKIERDDLKKPITMEKVEQDTSNEDATLTGIYQLTSPRNIFVDDSKLETVITGFAQLYASGVEVLNPTAAQIKERGLDKPRATVRVTYEGKTYTLKIGKPVTCEATDDKDSLESGHTHSVIGYNVMRDGTDIIYLVSESNLPWLTLNPEKIMSSFIVLPNIVDVKTVTVTFDGKTHVFDTNKSTVKDEDGDENDVFAPIYNGKKSLEEDYFKSFYQVLLSVYQTGINYDDITSKPELTIQYDYLDRSKKSDKLEFYNNNGAYVMSANGNMAFLTRLSYVNNVKEATAQIIENQKVVVN